MLVPELPAEIADLKRAIGRFVVEEVYPLEQRIAERNAIDPVEVDALKARARAAGFAMLNMPPELGGRDLSMLAQVAIEEESGKATNGLGFAVVDRGPRELLELFTAEQVERYVLPIVRGEYREAWALTEPGAGSDLAALAATADRDGDDWVLNGEKWFVTCEGDPASSSWEPCTRGNRCCSSSTRKRPASRSRGGHASSTIPTSTTTWSSCCATVACPTPTACPAEMPGRESGSSSSACSSPRVAAAPRRACSTRRPRGRTSARPSAGRSSRTRASRSRSPTPSPSSMPRGS